jgi:pyridoxamine 5'-phosphate oxidase
MTTAFDEPKTFADIEWQIWQLLQRGVADRKHGFHTPTVSTIGLDGKPKSRVMILRKAESAEKTLRLHADVRTQKWPELAKTSAISVSLYDVTQRVQLRVEGEAKLHNKDDVARAAWTGSQPMSRVGYGSMPGPGALIDSPDQFTLPESEAMTDVGYENFGVIIVRVQSIEWLHLKQRQNRRAIFDLVNNETQWLVP